MLDSPYLTPQVLNSELFPPRLDFLLGSTLSVTVIVLRNRIGNTSSNPCRCGLRFTNSLGENMNPSVLKLYINIRTNRLFRLVLVISLGKGKLNSAEQLSWIKFCLLKRNWIDKTNQHSLSCYSLLIGSRIDGCTLF